MLNEYNLSDSTIVQSFDHEVLKFAKSVNSDMKTLYLENFFVDRPTDLEEMQKHNGLGSHFRGVLITEDLVRNLHEKDKIIGAWVDKTDPDNVYEESEEYLKMVVGLGVDFITTDFPRKVKLCLDKEKVEGI